MFLSILNAINIFAQHWMHSTEKTRPACNTNLDIFSVRSRQSGESVFKWRNATGRVVVNAITVFATKIRGLEFAKYEARRFKFVYTYAAIPSVLPIGLRSIRCPESVSHEHALFFLHVFAKFVWITKLDKIRIIPHNRTNWVEHLPNLIICNILILYWYRVIIW
jgi:hypothetical protein